MSEGSVTVQQINMAAIKQGMRSTWMAGDFGKIAKSMTGPAEAFVGRLGIGPGMRVLDVACGTGNTAIPEARAGAEVVGVDIATNLLEQARERAAEEGLAIEFIEGDAEGIPFKAETFDAVVTMFGAMFAPRYKLVASEMARVLKPGGLLAMGNWNPGSFSGAMFKVSSRFVAPHPALAAPVLWGDEATVVERLSPHFEAITTEIVPVDFDMPMSPAEAVDFFRRYFGPTQTAFARLDEEGRAEFHRALEELWAGANVAEKPKEHTLIRNEYLMVRARKRLG
ncbi:MAG TPA: methyltransferase domain-containing protein [Acidobacteriaceae bacterium]|nr:methyltransferase domain-containing protein [Acidobacteriaceae bacterium]